jgi:uncharacterized protein
VNTSTVRTFGFSAVATLAIWVATAWGMGLNGLIAVVVLTVLEITFSVDNAVVNAKLIGQMSPFWQYLFLYLGIFIAVFVVRFFLPVAIVSLTSGLSLYEVVQLTLQDPHRYGEELHKAAPGINSFGGTFLLMIATAFFLDTAKKHHWVSLEHRLSRLGCYDNVGIFVLLGMVLVMTLTAPGDDKLMILLAGGSAILIHVGLGILSAATGGEDEGEQDSAASTMAAMATTTKQVVGTAAAVIFLRLELLDASFSLDGVIAAFALSTNVIVIMAGLGAGALWVRSGSIYMVRMGTLAKFIYLDNGAHWAIGALGVIMYLKVYHVELPEWLVASIGLVLIAWAVWSSHKHRLRKEGIGTHRRGRLST